MKTKVTPGYERINKDAFIGKSRKNVITVNNRPVKATVTRKSRTGCGGCSRRRPT